MWRSRSWAVCLVAAVALLAGGAGQPARAAARREPVIVIPGVAGSELVAAADFHLSTPNGRGGTHDHAYAAGEKVWVNAWEAALPGPDDYFDVLKLQPDAATPVAPLAVGGVYADVYDDLLRYLERQGYVQGVDLWVFPYDWRRDIGATAPELDALVERALVAANGGADRASWAVRRVDLVGHSMGGMVARNYVSDPARAARVDQLITLGSPQLGSVKFLKTLLYGDTFGPYVLGIGLDPQEIRDVVQNMPGALQLLPSRPYYCLSDGSADDLPAPYVEDRDVDGDGQALGALGYDALGALLGNLEANRTALGLAEAYHGALDEGAQIHGVRWHALVGTGHGTVGQLREYTGTCWGASGPQPCPKRDELPVDGDGTVPVLSAAMGDPWREALLASGAELWYVEREHGALVAQDELLGMRTGDGPALAWVGRVLSEPSRPAGAALAPAVFLPGVFGGAAPLAAPAALGGEPARTPPPGLSGVWVSALGPVALEVADERGRTAGRAAGQEQAQAPAIPGASYERAPEAEFAFVARGGAHELRLAAEGAGSVDLKLRVLAAGRVERTAVYLGVPLGPQGRASLALSPGAEHAKSAAGWPALALDADGDGAFEARVPASAVLEGPAGADTTPPALAADPLAKDASGAAVLRWYAADAGSGLLWSQATLDPGTPGARTARGGEALALSPGAHRVVVLAQDRAGNTSVREIAVDIR